MTFIKHNYKKDRYYPYLVKNINGDYYLYNITTNAIFLMDEIAYKLLVEEEDPQGQEYEETLKFLEDNFVLVTPENDNKLKDIYTRVVNNKKALNSTGLTLMITQQCNLRCKYCYGKDGEYSNKGIMDFSVAKRAVDFFVNQAPSDALGICFFGGEPLINFDLIKEVITYIRSIENSTTKRFTFAMTTNGTLINKEIRKFIEDNKISLTISIDGTQEMNDVNRYYANKKGIYDDIKSNIKDINTYTIARATIAPPNYDVTTSINHLAERFEFNSIAWAEADNLLSDSDYEKVKKSTLELIDILEEYINKGQYEIVKKYHTFLNMLSKFNSDGLRSKGCGAGSNLMAVDIDGKIYPCHRFVGLEEFVMGNVVDNRLVEKDFYSIIDLNNFEKCQSCLAKSICGGGCINENYYATESINIPSEKHCKFRIDIVNRMLEVYIQLSDQQKKMLFNHK